MAAIRPKMKPMGRKSLSIPACANPSILLPNLLTASNMVLGLLAIVFAINDSLALSWRAKTSFPSFCRPSSSSSRPSWTSWTASWPGPRAPPRKFGMEFDSLSDLISFGVAPGLLIYLSVLRNIPILGAGLSITLFYIVCTAIRLARFNVQAQVEEKSHFTGLPSPAAAGLLASYVLFAHYEGWYEKAIIVNPSCTGTRRTSTGGS